VPRLNESAINCATLLAAHGVWTTTLKPSSGVGRDEILREQIVCGFADLIRVLAILISLPQPLQSGRASRGYYSGFRSY
jgi:hypothetical protein